MTEKTKHATNFYVYLLLDPRKFYAPFYVGKGRGDRACVSAGYRSSARHNRFKMAIINKLTEKGMSPILSFWAINLSEEKAFEIERSLISRFGRRDSQSDGLLTNLTNGGEGLSGHKFSDEHRSKIGAANKGRKRTAAQIAALSSRNKDYVFTDQHRANLSAALKGNRVGAKNPMYGKTGPLHPSYGKAGLSGDRNGMFGRTHSEEARAKISEAAIRREVRSGKDSPHADLTIYRFIHTSGKSIDTTIFDFSESEKICRHQLGNVKRGKQKTCKGWSIVSVDGIGPRH